MNISLIFIVASILVLLVVSFLAFFVSGSKKENRLTPLAGIAFGFILAGILFGSDRVIGYTLLGVGVVFAIVDIVNRSKRR